VREELVLWEARKFLSDALIKTYYVPELDTLDVWFEEIGAESESEEVGDGVILKVGRNREVLGIEIVGLSKTKREDLAGLPSDARWTLLESHQEAEPCDC